MSEPQGRERLRLLPSVEEVVAAMNGVPHPMAVQAARETIADLRRRILGGEPIEPSLDAIRSESMKRLEGANRNSLVAVINATGVILHTNLGRAPLAPRARDAVAAATAGYSNLELDLDAGERGSRHDHV
jgi:L-seryl-tRNA(Ser) seleniumtransferase